MSTFATILREIADDIVIEYGPTTEARVAFVKRVEGWIETGSVAIAFREGRRTEEEDATCR